MAIKKKILSESLDGSRKKTELSEDELNEVAGGGIFDETVKPAESSRYLNCYVFIPSMGVSGKVIEVNRHDNMLGMYLEYVIKLNNGGQVSLDSENDFEALPPGVTDKALNENGGSITF